MRSLSSAARWSLAMWLALAVGCIRSSESEVVVYTALDKEFSSPILDQFAAETGIRVRPRFDVESTKTVGLTQAIIAEGARPRCDVFWNNEILNTLRLEERGLLDSYRPKMAESYPAMYRSPDGTWHGFAGRARVLIVNTDLVPESERPTSIYDLADPRWRGRCGIAKPLFGTTATHAACLFAHLGDEEARQYFRDLKANDVQILAGNKQVALSVAGGQLAFGLTDTDDAIIELEHGHPVALVYPDREPDQLGTLFIPNTLAIIQGCRHPEQARRLVDFLLTPEVEARLADSPSAQIPLHEGAALELRVETPSSIKAMQVDFAAAARQWDTAAAFIRDEFFTAD
ncbi:MAG: extracellular solute-binding protein [Pirellulales bacterium]